MAIDNSKTSANGRQEVERTNRDMARWVVGLLLLFVGLFGTASVLFSFFSWEADQSAMQLTAEERTTLGIEPENLCGWAGARIGELLVSDSFGAAGILIPIIIALIGVRVIRQRKKPFDSSILLLFIIMILSSLTLGIAFGKEFSFCSSTGLGGAYGVEIGALIESNLGGFGTLIPLLGSWILVGVFINRNFINTVNRAGIQILNKSEKVAGSLKNIITPTVNNTDSEQEQVEYDTEEEESITDERVEPLKTDDEDEIYLLEDEDDCDDELNQNAAQTQGDDSPFLEIDLDESAPSRVVMGRGGLIELDSAPQSDINQQDSTTEDDSPFVEIKLDESGTPTEPIAEPIEEGVVTTSPTERHHDTFLSERAIDTDNLYDPLKDLANYKKPPVTLLEDYQSDSEVSEAEIDENKARIRQILEDFNIPIKHIKATAGPTVTLYEIVQGQGVKIAKIKGLESDIAQSLKALGIRIIAPIPGKGTVGIEVPNRHKQIVSMYSAVRSEKFNDSDAELPVVIGRTIQNENYVFDLAKMPHLLVAGATGQGKSVGLNAIITSLLYRKHPSQLKFVLIDPKMVEFSLYSKIERHFLAKMESEDEAIITDPRKAVHTLNALCVEMENRLELFKQADVRNISEYNKKFIARRLNPEKQHRYMPYIVVIVDEFADLIMTAREVEVPVMRLAQKARAAGIHLIIATQRPDVKVITGGIKANFIARIAFRVMQMIDSRTIIDQPGANQLIGRGDMLLSINSILTRIQCALVETEEVNRVVEFISKQQGYTSAYALPDYTPEGSGDVATIGEDSSAPVKYDSLLAEIARDAVTSGNISTSMIQRNYEVGFNRAGRIMTQLERAGIVGRQQGAKPRDILFHDMPSLEEKLQSMGLF